MFLIFPFFHMTVKKNFKLVQKSQYVFDFSLLINLKKNFLRKKILDN